MYYIPNDDTQIYNQWLKRSNSDKQLNGPTNQNSIKVPKVVKLTYKKRGSKTLGTSVINSPMSPPSLGVDTLLVNDFFDKMKQESKLVFLEIGRQIMNKNIMILIYIKSAV